MRRGLLALVLLGCGEDTLTSVGRDAAVEDAPVVQDATAVDAGSRLRWRYLGDHTWPVLVGVCRGVSQAAAPCRYAGQQILIVAGGVLPAWPFEEPVIPAAGVAFNNDMTSATVNGGTDCAVSVEVRPLTAYECME
jgi:hypothetical protein